jgi:hypothetical protein
MMAISNFVGAIQHARRKHELNQEKSMMMVLEEMGDLERDSGGALGYRTTHALSVSWSHGGTQSTHRHLKVS